MLGEAEPGVGRGGIGGFGTPRTLFLLYKIPSEAKFKLASIIHKRYNRNIRLDIIYVSRVNESRLQSFPKAIW